MKRISLFIMVIFVFFVQTLGFAQTQESYVVLGIPIYTTLEFQEDADQLFEQMISELQWLGRSNRLFNLVQSMGMNGDPPPSRDKLSAEDRETDPLYVITGTLVQEDDGAKVFEMSLWKLDDSTLVAVQELVYGDLNEALGFIPFFMWTLFSTLPSEYSDDIMLGPIEDYFPWKHKWLYLGARVGFSPRLYMTPDAYTRVPGVIFDAGLFAEVQLLSFYNTKRYFSIGLQAGAEYTMDKATFNYYDDARSGAAGVEVDEIPVDITTSSLMFPLVIKFNFKPSHFVLAPYVGAYYTLPLMPSGDYSIDLPLGYTAGFTAGTKAGPAGTLFLDLRFMGDIGVTSMVGDYGSSTRGIDTIEYQRYMLSFAIGFSWGFFDKKRKDEASGDTYGDGTY